MLNRVEIMGRLTNTPELRVTPSGTSVTSFSLATESDYKAPNGEKATDFFEVIAWRNTAEFISKHFTKGRMMVVAGRLKTEIWTDGNDKKRKSVKIIAESVYFGDSKRDDGAVPSTTYPTVASPMPHNSFAQQDFTDLPGAEEDDLPF